MGQPEMFVGVKWCVLWDGVTGVTEKVCCGGRRTKIALITCKKRGVVAAESTCNASCKFKTPPPIGG